jgi:hypothetical protein
LINAGASLAGGAASVVVAEKAGLSPTWAGVATAGGAIALSSLPKDPRWKEALYAAGLGAGGIVGVQLFAEWMAKRKLEEHKQQQQPAQKRQADGDAAPYVTRAELNDALSHLADKSAAQQKQATCDLLTALREEIKRVVVDMQPGTTRPPSAARPASSTGAEPYMYPFHPAATRGAAFEGDFMRNAEDERNAFIDEGRNAYIDQQRDAFIDEERNAFVDEERNALVDEERNAFLDEERNALVDEERNAFLDEERNALVDEERNSAVDE